jgi:hypothetical protein
VTQKCLVNRSITHSAPNASDSTGSQSGSLACIIVIVLGFVTVSKLLDPLEIGLQEFMISGSFCFMGW